MNTARSNLVPYAFVWEKGKTVAVILVVFHAIQEINLMKPGSINRLWVISNKK